MTGDEVALRDLLTEDVVWHADGGGKASPTSTRSSALTKPCAMLLGIRRKLAAAGRHDRPPGARQRPAWHGAVANGVVFQTMSLEIEAGRIAAVYTMRNPEKLARLN
jgi:RNA polymerase sigma-70 factor (ECF subfamily)